MSEITRRDALRALATAIAAAGTFDRLLAAQVHQMAAQSAVASGGAYTPTALSPHQYRTVERLADLIIPVENGAPGALEAGVPAWVDMLAGVNDQLKTIYVDGVAWLDRTMKGRGAADFATASPADQTALLDLIAYRRNESPDLGPGIQFFTWVRRMTVDGFYTSRIGMRDVYLGNSPSGTFTVPAESLEYALKRSPLA
jgi:gluconate 2-dehydrogenase gamma chain